MQNSAVLYCLSLIWGRQVSSHKADTIVQNDICIPRGVYHISDTAVSGTVSHVVCLQPAAFRQRIREKAFQNVTVARRSRRHRQVAIAEIEHVASPKKKGRQGHNKNTTSESEGGEGRKIRMT